MVMNKQTEALKELLEAVEHAIEIGDWKVDGRCDPDLAINRAKEALEQDELNLNCKSVQKRLATQWGYVEQPEQEPWPKHKPECTLHDIVLDSVSRNLSYEQIKEETNGLADEYMVSLYRDGMNYQINKQVQDSEVQEPVAWMSKKRGDVSKAKMYFNEGEEILPLYTHPAPLQNEFAKTTSWQGLSNDEVNDIYPCAEGVHYFRDIVCAIEAKLKEKNYV